MQHLMDQRTGTLCIPNWTILYTTLILSPNKHTHFTIITLWSYHSIHGDWETLDVQTRSTGPPSSLNWSEDIKRKSCGRN